MLLCGAGEAILSAGWYAPGVAYAAEDGCITLDGDACEESEASYGTELAGAGGSCGGRTPSMVSGSDCRVREVSRSKVNTVRSL